MTGVFCEAPARPGTLLCSRNRSFAHLHFSCASVVGRYPHKSPGWWSGLTFATCVAAKSERECQILNSTGNIYLLVVPDSNIRKCACCEGMRMLESDHQVARLPHPSEGGVSLACERTTISLYEAGCVARLRDDRGSCYSGHQLPEGLNVVSSPPGLDASKRSSARGATTIGPLT